MSNKPNKLKTWREGTRIGIFDNGDNPKNKVREISTSWGYATVDGRLGQRHQEVLDALIACAVLSKPLDEDNPKTCDYRLFIDSVGLRSMLGWDMTRYELIVNCIKDLMKSIVTVEPKNSRIVSMSGIIKSAKSTGKVRAKQNGSYNQAPSAEPTGKLIGGQLWAIDISIEWLTLIEDQPSYYPLAVLRLKHGESKKLAKFIHSHVSPQYFLSKALREWMQIDRRHRPRAKNKMLREADDLEKVGVVIDHETLKITKK